MTQYKVVALDLDGTLTNSDKVITPRTQAALEEAARQGVRIVLASGRPTVGIQPLADQLRLGENGGCILSYNGGKIIDCQTGEVLVQHEFPPELIETVCTYARYWNVVALTYDQTGIVTEEPENRYVLEEARINGIPVRGVPDLPGAITWPHQQTAAGRRPCGHAACRGIDAAGICRAAVHLPFAAVFHRNHAAGGGKVRLAGQTAQGPRPAG